ncbi:hypothetical protein J5N97_011254 [Dioscorea zingiberensis]|uniref:Ubiquitin-like domain-containing protein n=1 Tax=Dioscorea zingiberensis TaxID=325984 RepID=A0A9D5HNC4_9LILI|nr:hypothetical protein J5N97_011254 [Dioscorea zingiberensis]
MRLAAENLAGRFFYVEVEEDANVGALKKEIASKDEEIPESRLILMHGDGCVMEDEEIAVKEYGVEDGSIIYLFFSLDEPCQWPELFEDRFPSLFAEAP